MKYKKSLCSVLFTLMFILLLLLPAAQVRGDECSHQWAMISAVPATCTESGYELYSCSLCGAEKRETLAALGHIWSYCVTFKQATCTEDGVIRCYCARDNTHYKDETSPALGHKWGSWHITKQVTLNEWGVSERKCSRCEKVEKRSQRPLAYREKYGLTLLLSPLPAEVRSIEDASLTISQEISIVNTGETDMIVREYSCHKGITKELSQPLQLPHGQAVTLPLTCVMTKEEISGLISEEIGNTILPLTLCFYGSLESGDRVCTSNQVSWKLILPTDTADTSASTLRLTQTILSSCADPAGYQLTETLRCRISVTNTGNDHLSIVRLQTNGQTEQLLVQDLAPGETRELLWSHSITLEDAIAGYSLSTWQASWTEADDTPLSSFSNAIVVPVTSLLDLLLDIVPVNTSSEAVQHMQGDVVCFRLRLQNNSNLLFSDVTVFDPFHPDDPDCILLHLDEIQPEESIELEIYHTVTEEDIQIGCIHFTVTAQGYDVQGALHTWTSGEINVPTA